MKTFTPFFHASLVLSTAAVLLGAAPLAHAQTVITSVPYTISTGGKYVLGAKLVSTSTTVPAITINAPNVDLDLAGLYVSNVPGATASNLAVISVGNMPNVRIHDGLVANGGYGIQFNGGNGSRNYTVENVSISRCYQYGIYYSNNSIGSVVRNCTLSNLGGATTSANVSVSGVFTNGGVNVLNCNISNVTGTGSGSAYGLNLVAEFAVGNTISNCSTGIIFFGAGKYLNNLTNGCATPFSGSGVNAGGNN